MALKTSFRPSNTLINWTQCTYRDILKKNSASSHVLIFQQLLGLLPLFH